MSRDELLEAAANLELTRAKTATGGPVGTPSLEPAVERERLEFEKYKFENEVKGATTNGPSSVKSSPPNGKNSPPNASNAIWK